jgi:NADH-quinone oxidoreductase subunit M
VILAAFQQSPWTAFLAATTLIVGAGYTLWLVKRVVFGEVANVNVAALKDVSPREQLMLWGFAAGVLVLGLWPAPLTDLMDASIAQLVTQLATSKL